LANLRTVKIDPAYHPRVPLIITPQQIVDDLTASLNVIRTYTNCLASDVPAIEQAIAAGEYDDATRRIDAFTPLGEKWYPTIEGWLEWVRLDRKCEQWREQIERAKAGDE
jgi:hypothetical protein